MRKLSMFQMILLIVFGALAIAGILIFSFAVGSGTNTSVGPITIWGTLDETAFNAVLRQAADQNGTLSQVTYVQKDSTTYESDLTEALASGQGPDIFIMRSDYAYQDAGKSAIISYTTFPQTQFQSTFVDAASPFMNDNGVIAVPFVADPLVLFWNKDMLSSAGFASPPQYWDQVLPMAQKVTVKDDSGVITRATIAFGEYQNIGNAKDVLATLILQAGGAITSPDSAQHLTPGLIAQGTAGSSPVENALRFYTQFADPSKDLYSWNRSLPDAQQYFAANKLGLYVGYASEEPLIRAKNPNLNFAAAALPQIRGAARTVDTSHVYAFAISRTGKTPAAAIQTAFLLASAANSQAFSTGLGIPSARRDDVGVVAQGDQDLFNKMVITSHAWIDPDPVATNGIFQAMIENTTSGALLVSAAIQQANQALGHVLGL